MTPGPENAPTGTGSIGPGGYRQELKRTLGPFQVFAISFAFISVAVGIFGTSTTGAGVAIVNLKPATTAPAA